MPARRLSRHQKGRAAGAFPGATHWRPGCADTTSGGWVGLFLERPTSRQVALAFSAAAQGNAHRPPRCTERRTELLEAVLWPDAALLSRGICRCQSTLAASVALQAGIPTRPPLSCCRRTLAANVAMKEASPPTRPQRGTAKLQVKVAAHAVVGKGGAWECKGRSLARGSASLAAIVWLPALWR